MSSGLPKADLADLGNPAAGGGDALDDFFAAPPPPAARQAAAPAQDRPAPTAAPRAPQRRRTAQPASGGRRKKTITFYVSTGTGSRWEKQAKRTGLTKYEVLAGIIDSFKTVDSMREIVEQSTVSTTVTTSLLPSDPKAVRLLGGAGVGGGSRGIQVNMTEDQLAALDAIGDELGFGSRSWVAPLLNEKLPGPKEKHPAKKK
jgi:hypothetical protein